MKLTHSRYDEIEREATELLEDYGISRFPLDAFSLCITLGVGVVPYFTLDEEAYEAAMALSGDAFLLCSSSRYVIYYDEGLKPERVLFSLAHELGHIILNHKGDSEEEEAEANWFAAYILCPTTLVVRYKLLLPEQVTDAFGVSYECACIVVGHAQDRIRCRKRWKDYENTIYEFATFDCEGVMAMNVGKQTSR